MASEVNMQNVSGKKFLFLGGLHRSGTSILHRLLQEHKDISGFSNTGVPEDEGQHLQSVFPPAKDFGGPGRFAFYDESHLDQHSTLITHENSEKLISEWGKYYDFNKQVFIEKSPPNLIRSDFFRKMIPNTSFVFITRHPAAVSLATRKWQKTSIMELFLHWYVAHKRLLLDLPEHNDYLLIRYEDFVVNPGFYLNKICSLVDIDSYSPKLQVVNHNDKYFRMWNEEHLNGNSLEQIFPEIIEFMDQFGYTLSSPFIKQPKTGKVCLLKDT